MAYTLNMLFFSLYLNIRRLRKGPGTFFMGVLESPGYFLSVTDWEPASKNFLGRDFEKNPREASCWCWHVPSTDDVFSVRTSEDASGDAEAEPASSEQGNARPRPRASAHGTTGEEDHRRYQEDGEAGTNGALSVKPLSAVG